MRSSYNVLIELLADTDAITAPVRIRSSSDDAPRSFAQAFTAFAENGLKWASGEATEGGRKNAQRDLEDLADSGLVEMHRHAGRVVHVRLTDQGDQVARALAGLPDIESAILSLREVARIRDLGLSRYWLPCFAEMVPEWLLSRSPGETVEQREEWVVSADMAQPAFARRWLETCSSAIGHLWYRITPLGGEALADPLAGEPFPALPAAEKWAERLYDQRFMDTRQRLANTPPPDPNNIAPCPVPVSFANVGMPSLSELIAMASPSKR